MTKGFEQEFNDLIVDTFRIILKAEEAVLQKIGGAALTIAEMHLIEAVGRGHEQGRTVSEMAQELGITLPSVTVAINKLIKKGYLLKQKSERDARAVLITLTPQGEEAEELHRRFHVQMIQNISEELTDGEKKLLAKGAARINGFFQRRCRDLEAL